MATSLPLPPPPPARRCASATTTEEKRYSHYYYSFNCLLNTKAPSTEFHVASPVRVRVPTLVVAKSDSLQNDQVESPRPVSRPPPPPPLQSCSESVVARLEERADALVAAWSSKTRTTSAKTMKTQTHNASKKLKQLPLNISCPLKMGQSTSVCVLPSPLTALDSILTVCAETDADMDLDEDHTLLVLVPDDATVNDQSLPSLESWSKHDSLLLDTTHSDDSDDTDRDGEGSLDSGSRTNSMADLRHWQYACKHGGVKLMDSDTMCLDTHVQKHDLNLRDTSRLNVYSASTRPRRPFRTLSDCCTVGDGNLKGNRTLWFLGDASTSSCTLSGDCIDHVNGSDTENHCRYSHEGSDDNSDSSDTQILSPTPKTSMNSLQAAKDMEDLLARY
ncbi:hypothetical protein HDU79_011346 [Rhizoclosmatium sp. JEL0117]|nr:hypothetical protein HDU79_011346 [Rhizoclosmatium sp. JEL0117]